MTFSLRTFVLALGFCASTASAQHEHQLGRRKLAFLIPTLYGSSGLTLPNPTHQAHFDSSFQANFGPFNTAIASQLTSLPIPSPASGFTYAFDKSLGVYTRSAQSFGPILAERAETIGKDKLAFGFSHQSFTFDSMDGLSLSRVPTVFVHIDNPANPLFAQDIITADNFVDLRIGQTSTHLTYGLHDRLDVSLALPLVNANLGVTSTARIRRIGTAADPTIHSFNEDADRSQGQFSNTSSAAGIGDITARLKANVFKADIVGVSVGVDVRLPTGDPYDFLGSGALGVKPFGVLSFQFGRVSPHLNIGYQWNGKSVLAGDIALDTKGTLPRQLSYAVGFDVGVTRRFTLAADYLGQRVIDVERVRPASFVSGNGQQWPNTNFFRGDLNMRNGAVGFKVNAAGNLLASFNVLMKMGPGGLQDRFTPLVGLSYAF